MNNNDNVSLLLGNGSGSFNPHTTFAVGNFPNSITPETSTAMATWT
ncbi:hypothetical protein [[Phormidium] sp. ETS-05]|nr:hypothetical protein [[Phormidium] sp. ETS-05]